MRSVATACLLLAMTALASCGGGGKTTTVGGATVTTNDDGKTTSITTSEGSVTVGTVVDASKLGAPIYPGAKVVDGKNAASISSNQGSFDVASFTTDDAFESVYAYYKAHLPTGSEKMKMAVSGASTAMFQTGDPNRDGVSVTVTAKDGEAGTTINISHMVQNATVAPSASPAGDGGGS